MVDPATIALLPGCVNMRSKCGLIMSFVLLSSILRIFGEPASSLTLGEVSFRKNYIKKMMKDAWDSYKAHAWGEYAVFPITKRPCFDSGNEGKFQIGATIIESLDTLSIMNLREEFQLGQSWVKKKFDFASLDGEITIGNAFEGYVASLLSVYFLTSDFDFVIKAMEIVEEFLPNFNSPTGLPFRIRNPAKRLTHQNDAATFLSELGTFRLEFLALSALTSNADLALKADNVTRFLEMMVPTDGLLRDTVDVRNGQHHADRDVVNTMSSFHLTLVNDWLQNGRVGALEFFNKTLGSMIRHRMLNVDSKRQLQYLTERWGQVTDSYMHAYTCLSGGVYGLAAMSTHSGERIKINHHLLTIAINLTRTCREVSEAMPAGLAPAKFFFKSYSEEIFPEEKGNNLIPSVAYSYFVLYRLTGDPQYREWGWQMAQSIEKYAKADAEGTGFRGYARLVNVASSPPIKGGVQDPHFLGGTLKFLYLLFSDTTFYDLRNWTFNARGHLMPMTGPSRLIFMDGTSTLPPRALGLTVLLFILYTCVGCSTACLFTLAVWRFDWPGSKFCKANDAARNPVTPFRCTHA